MCVCLEGRQADCLDGYLLATFPINPPVNYGTVYQQSLTLIWGILGHSKAAAIPSTIIGSGASMSRFPDIPIPEKHLFIADPPRYWVTVTRTTFNPLTL